jgi:hypothetical protein
MPPYNINPREREREREIILFGKLIDRPIKGRERE